MQYQPPRSAVQRLAGSASTQPKLTKLTHPSPRRVRARVGS